MSVWVVRAGKRGEFEQHALDLGALVIGWRKVADLTTAESREATEALCREAYPENKPVRIKIHATQLWTFRKRIRNGDLVVLPLKSRSAIAIGKVTGPYVHRTDRGESIRHTRPVEWLRTDIPRTAFDQDLLYSLGAMQTVYRLQRDDAEARILAIVAGEARPQGPSALDDPEGGGGPRH